MDRDTPEYKARQRVYYLKYKIKNKEKKAASDKIYYKENRDKILKKCALWYRNNKDRKKLSMKKYNIEHADEMRATRAAYYQKNKVRLLANSNAYNKKNRE